MTGPQLRAARQSLGLSQAALAEQLDIHPQTLSDYERDVRDIPRLVELAVAALAPNEKKTAAKR
jgi:transcriptional regulator with XRE-family HTH domain